MSIENILETINQLKETIRDRNLSRDDETFILADLEKVVDHIGFFQGDMLFTGSKGYDAWRYVDDYGSWHSKFDPVSYNGEKFEIEKIIDVAYILTPQQKYILQLIEASDLETVLDNIKQHYPLELCAKALKLAEKYGFCPGIGNAEYFADLEPFTGMNKYELASKLADFVLGLDGLVEIKESSFQELRESQFDIRNYIVDSAEYPTWMIGRQPSPQNQLIWRRMISRMSNRN
jgi:hypothetical protein